MKRVTRLHIADTDTHQAAVSLDNPASCSAKGTIMRKLRKPLIDIMAPKQKIHTRRDVSALRSLIIDFITLIGRISPSALCAFM